MRVESESLEGEIGLEDLSVMAQRSSSISSSRRMIITEKRGVESRRGERGQTGLACED